MRENLMDLKKQMTLTLPLSYQMKCQDMSTCDTHRLPPALICGPIITFTVLGSGVVSCPQWWGERQQGHHVEAKPLSTQPGNHTHPVGLRMGRGWREGHECLNVFFSYYRNCEPIVTTNCHFPTSFRTLMDKFVLNFYKNEKQTKLFLNKEVFLSRKIISSHIAHVEPIR